MKELEHEMAAAAATSGRWPKEGNGRSATILLVDDDQELLRCLAEVLERFGYRVIALPKAETALSEIGAGTPVDAVITDYRLDGMDGIQFLYALRHLRPELPAIMLTGHGTLEGYVKAKGLGAVEFLQKPVRARDLARTIDAHLSGTEVRRHTLDRSAAMLMERKDA